MVPAPLLRFALRLDGVASIGVGLVVCLGLSATAHALGAPPALMLGTGLFCVAYGAVAFWLGSRPYLRSAPIRAIAIGNGLWAAGSIWLGFSGWLVPTEVGLALLLAQAAAVGLFALLQFLGLRQSELAPA